MDLIKISQTCVSAGLSDEASMLTDSGRHWKIARPGADLQTSRLVQLIKVSQAHVHAGRSETEIEYSVGFDANGIISALDCKAWCLAGAFMDLAWNDLYGVMTGLDMVGSWKDNIILFFLH